jgi:lipopolysaccharide transport system permease protein
MKYSLWQSLVKKHSIWRALAWFDVTQSYHRTVLGPWWYTLNIAIWSFAMTVVYGAIFGYPTGEYASFVLTGMIGWSWVSAMIVDGGAIFISQAHHVRNPDIQNDWLVLAASYKFLLVFMHQLVLVVVFMLLGVIHISWNTLYIVPVVAGLFVVSIPIISIVGTLFVRYRDIQRMVNAGMIMVLMVTPVFWKADSIKGWRTALVDANPFYHWVEIIRQPLLGNPPPLISCAYLAVVALGLYGLMIFFRRRYSPYVIFWI